MESRMIRLNARCAGGNAGKNSFKYSADIPSSWIKQLNMATNDKFTASLEDETIVSVSYTHLDVYKRQLLKVFPVQI